MSPHNSLSPTHTLMRGEERRSLWNRQPAIHRRPHLPKSRNARGHRQLLRMLSRELRLVVLFPHLPQLAHALKTRELSSRWHPQGRTPEQMSLSPVPGHLNLFEQLNVERCETSLPAETDRQPRPSSPSSCTPRRGGSQRNHSLLKQLLAKPVSLRGLGEGYRMGTFPHRNALFSQKRRDRWQRPTHRVGKTEQNRPRSG